MLPLPMPGGPGPMGPPPMPGGGPLPMPGGPMGPPPMAPPGNDTGTLMTMLAMNFKRKTSLDQVREMVKLGEQIRKRDEKLAPRMSMVLDMLRGGPEMDQPDSGTPTVNDPERQ